jgi:hypothetical protein
MASKSSSRALVESMESRVFLSATVVGTPVVTNISKLTGPQENPTIAIDKQNPSIMYAVADNNSTGLFTAISTDGGVTWTSKVQFTGADGFPNAGLSPSVAFDSFGNLFIAYQRTDIDSVIVLNSYDNGQIFHVLRSLPGVQQDPVLTVGANVVLLGVQQAKLSGNPSAVGESGAVMYASKVSGLGRITPLVKVTDVTGVISDIQGLAVGPAGQFSLSYQYATSDGPSVVFTRTDADGVKPRPFSPENDQIGTQVGQAEDIPAQSIAGVNAGGSLAYDASADQFTGRLYMVYLNAPSPTSPAVNVYLVYSDDDGTTWSNPIQVTDDNSGNSHFNPQIAVDPVTGTVGVMWYDARNDNGIPPTGGTNNAADDEVQVYGAVGTATENGVSFSPNFVIQPGFSNANTIINYALSAYSTIQLGTHNSLVFYNGQMTAAWADNSNSTHDNGDGTQSQPDIYTAVVNVQTTSTLGGAFIGAFGTSAGPLRYKAANGTTATFNLVNGNGYLYVDANGNLQLRVTSTTTRSSLSIATSGGTRRISLSGVTVNGSLGSIVAPAADVIGDFLINGQVNRVVLGNVTGAALAATGNLGTVTVASLSSADLLSGASPGADGVFAGATDHDDAFFAGAITSLIVTGTITQSFIGAGVNPIDGVFGNGNDVIIGGTSSKIGRIRAGAVDAGSMFEAGAFGLVRIPQTINPAADPRFFIG